jgi:hypothetical protein
MPGMDAIALLENLGVKVKSSWAWEGEDTIASGSGYNKTQL